MNVRERGRVDLVIHRKYDRVNEDDMYVAMPPENEDVVRKGKKHASQPSMLTKPQRKAQEELDVEEELRAKNSQIEELLGSQKQPDRLEDALELEEERK